MASSTSSRIRAGGGLSAAMFSTRRGAITTAAVAAGLAAILLFVFLSNYKKGSAPAATNTPVFLASGYIPRGTPASVIATSQLLTRTTYPSSRISVGAIADPAVLRGEVAAVDIYPGQEITAGDFTVGNVTIASQLTGAERAIAIPVDAAHGLIGYVAAGDHVDVLSDSGGGRVGAGGVNMLAQDIDVISAPGGATSTSGGNLILRVTPQQANTLAFAADNGKIWITLRPPIGALGTTTTIPPSSKK